VVIGTTGWKVGRGYWSVMLLLGCGETIGQYTCNGTLKCFSITLIAIEKQKPVQTRNAMALSLISLPPSLLYSCWDQPD